MLCWNQHKQHPLPFAPSPRQWFHHGRLRIGQTWLPLHKSMLTTPDQSFLLVETASRRSTWGLSSPNSLSFPHWKHELLLLSAIPQEPLPRFLLRKINFPSGVTSEVFFWVRHYSRSVYVYDVWMKLTLVFQIPGWVAAIMERRENESYCVEANMT